jgi:hypothetical protein
MPLDDLEDRLSSLDELWKTAKTDGPSGNWLPDEDGDYQGILVQVDFFEQKKEPVGKAWLKLIWELQETNSSDRQYAGMQVSKLYDLEPQLVSGRVPASTEEVQQKLGFLKRDLKTLGIDVEAEDFSMGLVRPGSPIWDVALNCPYDLAVKTSTSTDKEGKPYRNLYVNARLGGPLTGDVPADVPAPATSAQISGGRGHTLRRGGRGHGARPAHGAQPLRVTHPAPNEPSEVQATHAWEVEQRILATARILREAWVDLARDLYEFFTQSLWRDLGHFSFDEWAETPSVGFGRRWAYEHIRIYRELVVLRDVEPDRLRTLEPSKVQQVLPAISRKAVSVDRALADVESCRATTCASATPPAAPARPRLPQARRPTTPPATRRPPSPRACPARPAAPTSPRPRSREDRSRCLTKATLGRPATTSSCSSASGAPTWPRLRKASNSESTA